MDLARRYFHFLGMDACITWASTGRGEISAELDLTSLMRGRARAFSAERLMQFLSALGHDVEIRVKSTRKHHGRVSVVAA